MQDEDSTREDLLARIDALQARVRELEESRPASEEGYRQLYELVRRMCDNVPDMIWAKDIDKNYIFANRAICEHLLVASDTSEPLGRNDLFFAQRARASHPEDPQWHTFGEICQDSDAIVLQNRQAGRFDEFGNVKGRFLYLDVFKAPFWDEQGRLIGTVGCGRDVTRERQVQEELRRSESRFKTIYNNADISIWEEDFSGVVEGLERLRVLGIEDLRGHLEAHPDELEALVSSIQVSDVNEATLALYGAPTKEALLGDLRHVLLPETRAMLRELVIAIAEGRPRFEHETVNRTLDGRRLHVLIRLFLPRNPEYYKGLLLCILDITARRELEEERRRNQKLESLGALAGGLAHDFNNLLMGITSSISLARMHEVPETGPALEKAERACERARLLTHQLLTFARGGAPVKRALPVPEFLRGAVNFALSGSKVACGFELEEGLWPIEADEIQLTQVVSSLVLNSLEAMPEGGVLRVQARNRTLEASGRVVEISVQDQGVGIPKELLHRVFDPYFSAKKGGRGLGLAIVHSVIRKHGGHIRLDSEVGLGTTVTLLLPAAEESKVRPPDEEAPQAAVSVLVMDDEEIVREVAASMLESMGHRVETSRDGREMLAKYQAARLQGAPFDAVIMDLTIPGGMGGQEAIQELLVLDPWARAIVSSGYSNDPVMADHASYGFAGVMPKPYTVKDLRKTLASVLAMKAPGPTARG